MQTNEDNCYIHGVSKVLMIRFWTALRDMVTIISWTVTLTVNNLYKQAVMILDFLAAVAIWLQSVADESSTLLPFVMPCWPGGSDYGPPEVEIDDTRTRTASGKKGLLKIEESLNVKLCVKSAIYDYHDCTVCLSKFCENETVYELPKCKHIFHKPCLSRWLRHRQDTCPLCRASLQPSPIADTPNSGERHTHQL